MKTVEHEGQAMWESPGGVLYSQAELEDIITTLADHNKRLKERCITEVFRTDYVTVYRRGDGKEAVVVMCNFTKKWPWLWQTPDGGSAEQTRTDAETAAWESMMESV